MSDVTPVTGPGIAIARHAIAIGGSGREFQVERAIWIIWII